MRGEEDGFAPLGEIEDQVFHLAGTEGVEPGGGLVEDHQVRIVDQRDCEQQALALAAAGLTFVGRRDALPEIFSYGHRNIQGATLEPVSGRLWTHEHGPQGGDEINLPEPGVNYGWPVISYGKEYWGPVAVGEGTHRKGMEQPIKQYTPSIAPGSLLLYSGKAFPAWRGNLFAGALKLRHINRVTLDAKGNAIGEERLLTDLDERIRALAESPQGWIYFSTDSCKVYRIKPGP